MNKKHCDVCGGLMPYLAPEFELRCHNSSGMVRFKVLTDVMDICVKCLSKALTSKQAARIK